MRKDPRWQLAEQAAHTRPGPMQRLLRYARWDADAVRDGLPTPLNSSALTAAFSLSTRPAS
ncbi:hypothetical protein [Streptomyces sp. B15]|uniref:hypothetical protein n=1 Tax=Streptomyces sp. B15 TaxID=1537797 RepID=UPI001FFC7D67|nr:hypothetical protein [Streptomyces sp. B15]